MNRRSHTPIEAGTLEVVAEQEACGDGHPSSVLRRILLPNWRQRKKMLRLDAWILVIGSYLLLALAFLWPQDFRTKAPLYNLIGYGVFMTWTFVWHLGVLLALVGVLAAWQRAWRLALATVPLLLVSLGPELWHFLPKSPLPIKGEAVTVMSVNLLYMNYDTAGIIEEIKAARPDILLLQEYSPDWHRELQESIGKDYPHITVAPQPDPFGAAIYSRRAFKDNVVSSLRLADVPAPQMRAVVEIGGRDVAIYNVHLLPPYGLGYTWRTRCQLADLIDILRNEGLPIILSGDFNFTERSPNAAGLHELGLLDTHTVAGFGRGSTWPVHSFYRYVPGIQLDHIYVRGDLTCDESRTGTGAGSDHRPIIATIGFADR